MRFRRMGTSLEVDSLLLLRRLLLERLTPESSMSILVCCIFAMMDSCEMLMEALRSSILCLVMFPILGLASSEAYPVNPRLP